MEDGMTIAKLKKKRSLHDLKSVKDFMPLYIRYDEGAYLFGVCRHTFMKLATDAEAKKRIPGTNAVLVDLEKVWRYIDSSDA